MFKTLLKNLLATTAIIFSTAAFSADVDMSVDKNNLAIQGYDPVAYFTVSAPTVGEAKYQAAYKGATYHFASAENRDKFTADPAKYAPQYGGFCAYGVANGAKFDSDPTAWKIVDNKLYLNVTKKVQSLWAADIPGFLNKSENLWDDIKADAVQQL